MKTKSKRRRPQYLTKVVHCQKEPYDILIDRSTPYGNPWSHKNDTLAQFKVETRKEAMDAYREHLKGNTELQERLRPLKGKTLGCWCKPGNSCHGDIIAEFLDGCTSEEEALLISIFGKTEQD